MCASTIWGRYHYVADVLAGIVTGTLGYVVGGRLMRLSEAKRKANWGFVAQEATGFGD